MPDITTVSIALIVLNVLSFLLFGIDKLYAKRKTSRVAEKWLLVSALPASSAGALLGMVVFNHKTSKPKFRYGVPAIVIAQALITYWLSA